MPFRCGFIVHLTAGGDSTQVDVIELTPTLPVGRRWQLSKEGVGLTHAWAFQLVAPTAKDRRQLLALIDSIARR